MKSCILVVQTKPVAGREAEFNDWYTNKHLDDVLKVPGFKSAQRYILAKADDAEWKYLALYEFESEEPEKVMDLLVSIAGKAEMALTEAMDMNDYNAIPWIAITEKKYAVL